MMKKIITSLFIILLTASAYSQQASTFFPSSPGYRWYFKNTPLDSLNIPQSDLATYQIDSFSVIENFQGLPGSTVLSKSGMTNINQNLPYTDTNHYNFQSTNAFYFLNILNYVSSIPGLDSVALINFLRSFEAWYNVYRFAQTVNTNYTIFSKDTTLNIDTLTLPLRISATGRRYNDETINTVNGNYSAKKFLFTYTISYGLLPPFVYIPIVTRPDTIYIAQNIWRIKEVMPSISVDMTPLGFPYSFSIPGTLTELTEKPTSIKQTGSSIPGSFRLEQNFPNPFNPVTKIRFDVPSDAENKNTVKLIVYNISGKKITELVNGNFHGGSYEVEFNGSDLSSGIYYYKLETENFIEVKKMTLIK